MSDHTTLPTLVPSRADTPSSLEALGDEAHRYRELGELGVGGMGEVALVRDLRLGRDVARKRIRARLVVDRELLGRFLREVRVQARLEHPAVVPVYDLGVTDGVPWFTMKRVRGQTLSEVLRLLATGDAATQARFSRFRLLSAFTTVCLAVDAAHASGVVHRDLKPGNIMLGEFGEVHVLDWGLARLEGAEAEERPTSPSGVEVEPSATMVGAALGTPGYMSPEQADGRAIDHRSDVYALGAILHELVYLRPLNDAPTPIERLTRARSGDLPERAGLEQTEFDAIWRQACQRDPALRFSSASALAEAVEHVLTGQRDEERRRALAAEAVAVASEAAFETLAGRTAALRALGRALALEPTNGEALRLLAAVLASQPDQTPPEAVRRLAEAQQARDRGTTRANAVRLATWTVGMGVALPFFGLKSLALGAVLLGVLALATALTLAVSSGRLPAWVAHTAGIVALWTLGLLLGPLVVVPNLAATHAMLVASSAPRRERAWTTLAAIAAMLVPGLLEPLGPYARVGPAGSLELFSPLVFFSAHSTLPVLTALSVLPVITPTVLLGRLRDRFVRADEQLVVQAVSLEQLIPR